MLLLLGASVIDQYAGCSRLPEARNLGNHPACHLPAAALRHIENVVGHERNVWIFSSHDPAQRYAQLLALSRSLRTINVGSCRGKLIEPLAESNSLKH